KEGEEYGNSGFRIVVEPHTPTIDIGMVDGTMPMRVRGSAFSDFGEVFQFDTPGRSNPIQMWGAGFGFAGTIGQTFNFRFSVGWALLDTPQTTKGTARAYFGV